MIPPIATPSLRGARAIPVKVLSWLAEIALLRLLRKHEEGKPITAMAKSWGGGNPMLIETVTTTLNGSFCLEPAMAILLW